MTTSIKSPELHKTQTEQDDELLLQMENLDLRELVSDLRKLVADFVSASDGVTGPSKEALAGDKCGAWDSFKSLRSVRSQAAKFLAENPA